MGKLKLNSHLAKYFIISVGFAFLSLESEGVNNPIYRVDYHWSVTFSVGLAAWMLIFTFNYFMDKRIPKYQNQQFSFGPWLMGVIATFLLAVVEQTIELKTLRIPEVAITSPIFFNRVLFNSIWLTIISRGVKMAMDYFDRSRIEALSNKSLKQEKLEMEFALLQQQLSPHFLFNSLNTLGDLIEDDKRLAQEFLAQFTAMFRYMLDSSAKGLVPLKEEVDFLQSYIHILKQRFKNNLKIEVDLSLKDTYMPPLTLRTLIENAMKHNECSKQYPLSIKIFNSEDNICVENNIRPRNDVKRNEIGLKNLNSRYLHLTSKSISYARKKDTFSVKLPLILLEI